MRRLRARVALLPVILAAGCDSRQHDNSDATGACPSNTLPLLTVDYGDTSRYFVSVELDGRDVALQLDTGSATTFLFQGPDAPPYTAGVASIAIGCETISVDGRNLSAPGQVVNGLEVVGLLGMGFLLDRPTLLDVTGRQLTRFASLPDALIDSATNTVTFDDVQRHALVPCALDGTAVRLMFDTGGGHTLWVGQDGRPGDTVVPVEDAAGNVFPVYVGTAELTLPPRSPRSIPVARAPAFPYFEQTVAALGGDLHGLLGVTAFPGAKLLVSGAEHTMYVIDE